MPRLSVPLTADLHRAIRARANAQGVPLAEVARRLLLRWLVDLELPQGEDYQALMDVVVDYYVENANGD